MTEAKAEQPITIKMIGMHAGVVGALAAAVITLGQFIFWTRGEGAEMKAVVLQMKVILERVEAEQARRTGVIAQLTERQENIATILRDVTAELRDLRKAPR